ncbi:MAG: metal ABC transporter substrate-binding protein [Defluviitoga tunisiensis]
MKRTIILSTFVLFVFFAFSLNVSTSITPYYLIVKEIIGEKGSVNLVIPAGNSPHTYSLTPQTLKNLYDSDVLILNGLNLEIFISKLTENLKQENIKIIYVSDYIPEKELITGIHEDEGEDNLRSNLENEELYNPHIWLDPYLVYTYIIPGLVEDLSKTDPENREFYSQNGNYVINRLVKLDNYLTEKSKQVRGEIFVVHNSFDYFSKRYNIKIAAVVESIPGVPPTPKEIIQLTEISKNKNVKAIFNEPQLSDKATNTIAKNLNLNVGLLDPLGSNDQIIDIDSLYLYNMFEIIRRTIYEK